MIGANALHGVHVTVGAEYEFDGVEVTGNSVATVSTSSGYKFEGISGIRIWGGRSGPVSGYSNAMAYGVNLDSSCTNFVILGTDVRGNSTAGMVNAAGYSATKIIDMCPGFVVAGSKVITLTRAMATASGNVGYTGIGFTPRTLIAFGGQTGGANMTLQGFCDAALGVQQLNANGTNTISAKILVCGGGGNDQTATVASLDSDGFTLAWTKTGAPGGADAEIRVLCLR